MTEADWFGCNFTFPQSMIRHVWGSSERKLRLFACHCCRLTWNALGDLNRAAVEVAERFADGAAALAELRTARLALGGSDEPGLSGWHASGPSASQAAEEVAKGCTFGTSFVSAAAKAALLRDIFANPFRPLAFDPAWRTDTAVSLARTMYESREFSAMPILADALQDAGCDNEDILAHCRDGNLVHVRGCWVIDLVLGKS